MRRRNPFDEVEQFFERMSRQFEEGDWTTWGSESISVDVAETDDEFVIVADLPGYEREDIDLKISGGNLRISADHEASVEEHEEDDNRRYIRRERRQRSVSRTVRLPEESDEDSASATYHNGVLTVTIEKAGEGDGGRKIDID